MLPVHLGAPVRPHQLGVGLLVEQGAEVIGRFGGAQHQGAISRGDVGRQGLVVGSGRLGKLVLRRRGSHASHAYSIVVQGRKAVRMKITEEIFEAIWDAIFRSGFFNNFNFGLETN